MKAWRWFVGQVARLRRSVADLVAPGAERAGENAASADEPAGGPPAHWVERVRQGAPGLLEPSIRRRDEPAGPAAERAVPSQTEPEPRPGSLEEPVRSSVPPEPLVGPRRLEGQAPGRPRLLRKVLRRDRSAPPADVAASPALTADELPRELHPATRRAGKTPESLTREPRERRRLETPESPAGKPADRRRPVDETEATPARHPPLPSEVVEFEAPAPPRAAQPAERPVRPMRADAAQPAAANVRQTELAVDELSPDRLWKSTAPALAPRRESNVERLREPALPRSTPQREPVAEPSQAPRRRAEPLAAIEKHPWPELPPPLDEVDGDVEAALRAWEHQQRIDHEQTRL